MLAAAALLYVVLFWRLGDASFWDPDEAHYAEATRELLQTGDRLAPFYNGQPFFDKPILFYWLQAAPMGWLADPEAGARLAPAIAGVLLVLITGWFGAQLFGAAVGVTAALMLATNAGLYGLARYAILDLPFTLFLFGGVAAITVGMLRQRRVLEYAGYALVGLANATKGPVALVLCGLAFACASVLSRDARQRLLALHWVRGMLIAIVPGLPWPIYMTWRFGRAFVDGYVLNENIRLFATPMYAGQPEWYFYFAILAVGMLPWTPLILAHAVDVLKRARARVEVIDVLLWSWVIAIVGFFSFSHFKLDHYVFPAAPALCVIAARGYEQVRSGVASRATRWAVQMAGPILIAVGSALAFAALVLLDLDRTFLVVPLFIVAGGAVATWDAVGRRDMPLVPFGAIAAMAVVFIGATGWVVPRLEAEKVVPDVARWVAAQAPADARIAAFRLNRWNTAFRFYVERPVGVLESDEDARRFFSDRRPYYCVMTGPVYDALLAAGVPMQVGYERQGRWVTSGRSLWRRQQDLTRFVVAMPKATTPPPGGAPAP